MSGEIQQTGRQILSKGALHAMSRTPGLIFKTKENQKESKTIRCVCHVVVGGWLRQEQDWRPGNQSDSPAFTNRKQEAGF